MSTEIKIKDAAHKVFLEKGFSATTIRDVAKEAGTNVALVNYYFRSKQNLFNVVMLEKVQQILGALAPILKDETTTLQQKIDGVINCYIDFLAKILICPHSF
ncbi:MAG: helix-turn-helix transcriptional regulator [Flammeovirgaceae bacterium]|nr:helix-turn-helix transcriptional regulator [Flammeovirgaceae bacterium]